MKLRHATLIAVPMLAIVFYSTYSLLKPSEDSTSGASAVSVRPSQSPVTVERGVATNIDDIAALREEVASLTAQISMLRQPMPTQPATAPSRTEHETDAAVRSDALARAETAREQEARIAVVDAAFRKQAIDPTWSANTSSAIQNALRNDEAGGIQAQNIDCRSDSCRVELHDDGSGSLSKSMPMLAQQLAGTLPTATANTIAEPGGGSTMVLYLSRQGEEQPSK